MASPSSSPPSGRSCLTWTFGRRSVGVDDGVGGDDGDGGDDGGEMKPNHLHLIIMIIDIDHVTI